MNEEDFPSLYIDANETSIKTQVRFLLATKTVLIGSLIVSGLALTGTSKIGQIAQVVIAIFVLLSACYLLFGKPQTIWYSTRALAESIKTITWRFVMKADPFDVKDAEARTKFRTAVSELLRANEEASALRYESAHTELITKAMTTLRATNLDGRVSAYSNGRLEDQLDWYRRKSRWNDVRAKAWYGALIFFSILAIAVAFLRPFLDLQLPVDLAFSIPIAVLGWIQIKRFQELASSYGLTAHEITFAKNDLAQAAGSEEKFQNFVGNTENAFSREHTQWYARKDLG